ncbi:MAG: inositol monophosphatase [Acidobacteria bacterium]|nr:inositol monophosphatase [Acidobacteriota bacterium]
MNPFLDVAIEAAREAGKILLAEYDHPAKISYKGEVDLVTEADRRSEQAVVVRLRSHFPKHAIVAEEGGGHEAPLAPGASSGTKQAARGYCWYVDPLDGTTNFAHGYPCFAVSIALAENVAPGSGPGLEDLLVGVVYNPINGELFTAVRDDGAFLNQKKIQVSSIERLATSLLATGFPSVKRAQNPNIHYYWDFTLRSHGVRRDGSAALDLASVACGRFDGFWEFGLKPWDTAAGVLLVGEAGGMCTDFAGRPYRLGGPELLASNKRIHEEMQQVAADIAERAPQRSN